MYKGDVFDKATLLMAFVRFSTTLYQLTRDCYQTLLTGLNSCSLLFTDSKPLLRVVPMLSES